MRHRAALALAHVEPVAFAEHAAKDLGVKILGNDEVVDGDNKMIEGLSDGHVNLQGLPVGVSHPACSCLINQSAI